MGEGADQAARAAAEEPRVIARIEVQLLDNGQCRAVGPVENAVLCYGLLEAGKDDVRDHNARLKSRIVVPA